jgi:hypothetical protein
MNERILKIARQVWPDPNTSHVNHMKFAELIINECIDQVAGTKIVGQILGDEFGDLSESARNKYKQWNNALVIATMNVRDHFGVEE